MFANRKEAGQRLAAQLKSYHRADGAIVLGIPRGGVVVAAEVARALDLPLDIVAAAKVGAPDHPEYAVGAVAPDGVVLPNPAAGLSPEEVGRLSGVALSKIRHEIATFRAGRTPLDLQGRTAILVDDGLATGLTAMAAADWLAREGASRVVVAVPVAPPNTLATMSSHVDEVVAVEVPAWFSAVGQFYNDFSQTEDAEVVALLSE
ncbi:MAG: phosphoribosyltransferase [Actinobacteria bacterium HGW-Actinobacteria-7]|nr:MAG: phosphoribosyltransferase [Actinobacteria bacterium HGW-Actinobacteria-7]